MNIKVGEDLEILELLRVPHNAYEVSNKIGNKYYSAVLNSLKRLESLKLIMVVKTEVWHAGEKKWYQTTPKGERIIRALKNKQNSFEG